MEIGPYIGGRPAVHATPEPMTRRVLNITIYDDLLSVEECRAVEECLRDYLCIEDADHYKWTLRQDVARYPPIPDESTGG